MNYGKEFSESWRKALIFRDLNGRKNSRSVPDFSWQLSQNLPDGRDCEEAHRSGKNLRGRPDLS